MSMAAHAHFGNVDTVHTYRTMYIQYNGCACPFRQCTYQHVASENIGSFLHVGPREGDELTEDIKMAMLQRHV